MAWLLVSGSVQIRRDGKMVEIPEGNWVVSMRKLREQKFSPKARIITVRFQAHWPDNRSLFDPDSIVVFPKDRFPELERNARELLALARPFTPKEDYTLLAAAPLPLPDFFEIKIASLKFIHTLIQSLSAYGLRPPRLGTQDERVLKALAMLDLHPLHRKLRDSDLSQKVGLGLSQFVRLFQEETGMTPKKYFEIRRMKNCEEMLVNTAMPLKQLCEELGFSHHSSFSSWFRKKHQLSPKEFRDHYSKSHV